VEPGENPLRLEYGFCNQPDASKSTAPGALRDDPGAYAKDMLVRDQKFTRIGLELESDLALHGEEKHKIIRRGEYSSGRRRSRHVPDRITEVEPFVGNANHLANPFGVRLGTLKLGREVVVPPDLDEPFSEMIRDRTVAANGQHVDLRLDLQSKSLRNDDHVCISDRTDAMEQTYCHGRA
jgi:hypothetical protein